MDGKPINQTITGTRPLIGKMLSKRYIVSNVTSDTTLSF
jgi:hypothetical protein